ncbi:zinc finger protein ZAT12-like [Zingiber officinale]|uniref:C2H2-type domain-containing protein n=1 Tax=Zingiber officinale TaxID=94328 RepID=A0A8J5KDM4_ZINOF|nr:zinc finger protein ZAT12-like [Zingiber officinale]KAG6476913.1 hypothetical protein ZIOFF_066161 [Zingiber officinale]
MFGGMKRFRGAAGGDVEMLDSMAHALMLLSHGRTGGAAGGEFFDASAPSAPARVFECKTCSRKFTSFQALGGHRASHKKPKIAASDGGWEAARPRVHECSICGLEFAIGQALGGHMRRHRVVIPEGLAQGAMADEGERRRRKTEEKRALPWLDLNVAPTPTAEVAAEAAASCRKKIFGFELVDTTSVAVDCFR